jgi:pimeloyl-ACP methyl ester carboxylesterase
MNPFRSMLSYLLLAAALAVPTTRADAPPPPLDPAVGRAVAGTYAFSADHAVTLGPFDEFGGHLAMLDLKTRDQRILMPQADGSFTIGTTTIAPTPVQATLRFERGADGRATALVWTDAGDDASRTAARVFPTRHETVEFRNGDVVLRGTLSLPEGPGPHPAVVMVHGSGAATRNIGFFTTVYERLGIAVLSFDKRGAGESTGNWKSAPFDDLVGDVLAGVAMLKARPDIDGARIGLEGSSQGGWIGSMAAARAPDDVAWLIVRVGSGVSVLENMLHEDVLAMRKEGLDAAQTAEVVEFDRAIYTAAMRGEPREAGVAIAAKYADRPWFPKLYPDGFSTSENGWAWLHANAGVESVDHLRRVRQPVAWYLGATDGNVPSARSMPRIVQALLEAGNDDFAVTMLPSDHSFFERPPGDGTLTGVSRYVPGFLEANATWLRARGFAGN